MIHTLSTLAAALLLLADNQFWVSASQLTMEVSPPKSQIGGVFVTNLDLCPPLPPRSSPPSSVNDLYVQAPVMLLVTLKSIT